MENLSFAFMVRGAGMSTIAGGFHDTEQMENISKIGLSNGNFEQVVIAKHLSKRGSTNDLTNSQRWMASN